MATLHDLLKRISAPQILRPLCENLARRRRFIDYAYLHSNGFFVIYVVDPDLGLQVRLHVWAPDRPPSHEQPHRHRMGFVSRVIWECCIQHHSNVRSLGARVLSSTRNLR